ncbi:hypothetical protein [Phyllobacterium zundukense]|uniref:Uncharacterized protein n=1 Tax=Phyllobacterium zundukense TaxID=1867719 RepID=A0ACD4D1D1_9HYPH|nr:hypothetical protein [Phyllobacterium zundukense]UXN59530.1 hypothetical protein N8E88_23515 [Phyllobacterium zundukense]
MASDRCWSYGDKLFEHKARSEDDEILAINLGIGLLLFNRLDPVEKSLGQPGFIDGKMITIMLRNQRGILAESHAKPTQLTKPVP